MRDHLLKIVKFSAVPTFGNQFCYHLFHSLGFKAGLLPAAGATSHLKNLIQVVWPSFISLHEHVLINLKWHWLFLRNVLWNRKKIFKKKSCSRPPDEIFRFTRQNVGKDPLFHGTKYQTCRIFCLNLPEKIHRTRGADTGGARHFLPPQYFGWGGSPYIVPPQNLREILLLPIFVI